MNDAGSMSQCWNDGEPEGFYLYFYVHSVYLSTQIQRTLIIETAPVQYKSLRIFSTITLS